MVGKDWDEQTGETSPPLIGYGQPDRVHDVKSFQINGKTVLPRWRSSYQRLTEEELWWSWRVLVRFLSLTSYLR